MLPSVVPLFMEALLPKTVIKDPLGEVEPALNDD